jgi:hypothetical protein
VKLSRHFTAVQGRRVVVKLIAISGLFRCG